MLPAIEGLLVLQDRDRRLLNLQDQLTKLPQDEARAKDRLSSDLQAVDRAKTNLLQMETQIKNLELDIGTRQTTIERLRNQQFETKKNEEYRALGNEVERYGREVDELETRQLELMELSDGLRKKLEEARQALKKSEAVVEEDLANIAERRKQLENEISETQGLRSTAASKIEEEMLSLYDRLMVKKNGLAVTHVASGQCGGCHVKLIPATLIKVNGSSDITQCENCGRILYPEG